MLISRLFAFVSATLLSAALWAQDAAEDPAPAADPTPAVAAEPVATEDSDAKAAEAAAETDPAQDAAEPDATPGVPAETPPPAVDPAQAKAAVAQFASDYSVWKDILADLRSIAFRYKAAREAERKKLQAAYDAQIARGEELMPRLKTGAEAAYAAQPGPDSEAGQLIAAFLSEDIQHDRYADALRRGLLLAKHSYPNARVYAGAGHAAYALHDFDLAKEMLKKGEQNAALDGASTGMIRDVEQTAEHWEQELLIRAAEAAADDLPRVKLQTSQGDIVLELFENEAPNTVANFISLVEKGFYDGLTFHRVLPNAMAQGGDPKGDGSGGPGYAIFCECKQENFRRHFRGSLSMAHAGLDSGGSQFFLTFLPRLDLDGKHTVFGRILAGEDLLQDIQRINPEEPPLPEPDKIIKAEVLRKRDHAYEPAKLAAPDFVQPRTPVPVKAK